MTPYLSLPVLGRISVARWGEIEDWAEARMTGDPPPTPGFSERPLHRHHHHFICPTIQQYAHLRKYDSSRAGQQGPIRTLTAALKRSITPGFSVRPEVGQRRQVRLGAKTQTSN